jgi:hypothetical protein
VGLTEAKIKSLKEKDFDKLYEARKKVWEDAATNAKEFVKKTITNGGPFRPEELLELLVPVVRTNQFFRDHQHDNSARSPKYITWFAEYIIDKNP